MPGSSVPPPSAPPKDDQPSPEQPPTETTDEGSATPAPKPDLSASTPSEKTAKPEEPVLLEPSAAAVPAPSLAPGKAQEAEQEDDSSSKLDLIHMDTFNQILELDEDEDTHDFSQPMVWAYFEQAEKTFEDMKSALAKKDLETLSSLGHFLKGSSAALGLSRVQHSCEQIQHLGQRRDEERNVQLSGSEALAKLEVIVKRVQVQYNEAELWLKEFFAEED